MGGGRGPLLQPPACPGLICAPGTDTWAVTARHPPLAQPLLVGHGGSPLISTFRFPVPNRS